MPEVETSPKAANVDGMRCYIAGILFPIIFLTLQPYKSNSFVRFHAFQSIVFTIAWIALTITTESVRFQMRGVNAVLSCLWFLFPVMWIVLMFKAYRGERFKLPVVGDLAARWAR